MSIFIIGEAWGIEEARQRTPFVGGSGYELTKMLSDAGIRRSDCYLTNVFNLHPPANDLSFLCGPPDGALPGYPKLLRGNQKDYSHYTGDYVKSLYLPELERLSNELLTEDPNVVVCLGNTALWALLGKTAISRLRGTTTTSTHCAAGFKLLPTYHPAAVLRQWSLRPVVVVDFQKVLRESKAPDIIRSKREIWIEPTLDDINEFFERFLPSCEILSVDIETLGREITCIGFAPNPRLALVVPFRDPKRLGRNYWPTFDIECKVWKIIRQVLESPEIPKLFQNGLFDVGVLYKGYGIRVAGAKEDTMLLHYSLQPESLKGLGFLGSIYCDEGNWKDMRPKKVLKRDD